MNINKPTIAYVGATWAVLAIGVLSYLMGLFDAQNMELNEKGYYFTVLMFGLYSAISLQKTVRDQSENIPTSRQYYIISWLALAMSVALLILGLYNNHDFSLSEKGFYLMAYTMSVFSAITIQKNVRDLASFSALDDRELLSSQMNKGKPSQINHTKDNKEIPLSISERIANK